jgi:hypothetical protein
MITQKQCFDGPDCNNETVELTKQSRLLMHATIVLLALNAVIAIWFFLSPSTNLAASPKPDVPTSADASYKPSPFQPVGAEKAPKGVRRPPKAEPFFSEVVRFEATPSHVNVN